MNSIRKGLSCLAELIVPKGSDIRVGAFNILATCGIVVSAVVAFYNLFVGARVIPFFECLAGVFISLGLMYFTRKTGNYRAAMILTVLIIFLGLFTFIYLASGGYYAGMPFFFVFAVVFTAFLLDGIIMPVLIIIELMWYGLLCLYSYYHPETMLIAGGEKVHVLDAVVCESIVSISLALTMYFQIRIYRKKQQELNAAILDADEANKAKSDFLGKMSHDIRTPINTILAMNELIVANTSSARIREWVNDSNVSGKILLSLIDDMLDLTKIEAGKMEMLRQPWDTSLLFEETQTLWKPLADRAGLDFEYNMDPAVPSFLIGDEDVIRKITNNLVSNSIKYTKSGSVSLKVKWDGELVIIVSDTGIGIAPEYLKNIFKPFERGAGEVYRETSGSGLGLAIVKELVDAADGSIDCSSVVNEGTVFTVRLPQQEYRVIDENPKAELQEQSSEPRTVERFVAPDASILVVDDTALNHKVIEDFLEPTLIHIDGVESGYEALEMIDIKNYDLILMDLRMPKMDGVETLERIRDEYPDLDTPIIVLTADIMNGIKERMLKQGFADFLSKPLSSARLYETIRKYIPDKIISIETEEESGMTIAKVESYQDILLPYGINIKTAIENNAGNADEFLKRATLFEEYAQDGINYFSQSERDENYYIQIHSTKSVARGIGAYLLAELAEIIELRKDDDFTENANKILVEEFERVRSGLEKLREEVELRHG